MVRKTSEPTNHHIRRTGIDPVFEKPHLRTTAAMSTSCGEERLDLRYRRSQWEADPDHPGIHQRETKAKLFVDGYHAGSFKLTELRLEPLIDSWRFFEWADEASSELAELAELVSGHWNEVSDVSDQGTILELTRAWMKPAYSNGRRFGWAANALVALSTEWGLLVLKAFPLEYERHTGHQYKEARSRRRQAMMRHYRSKLDVFPFPGSAGVDGWMYAVRRGVPIIAPTPCAWTIAE